MATALQGTPAQNLSRATHLRDTSHLEAARLAKATESRWLARRGPTRTRQQPRLGRHHLTMVRASYELGQIVRQPKAPIAVSSALEL